MSDLPHQEEPSKKAPEELSPGELSHTEHDETEHTRAQYLFLYFRLFIALFTALPLLASMVANYFWGKMIPYDWQFILSILCQIAAGSTFYIGTWQAAKKAPYINTDSLAMIATTTAFIYAFAIWAFELPGTIHFEINATLLLLLLLTRWRSTAVASPALAPIVLLVSIATLLFWWLQMDQFTTGLFSFIAVLVIPSACPYFTLLFLPLAAISLIPPLLAALLPLLATFCKKLCPRPTP